jgi:hypothetical protein
MESGRGYILPAGLGWNCWVCTKDVCTVLKALNCLLYVQFENIGVDWHRVRIVTLLYTVHIQAQGVHPQ